MLSLTHFLLNTHTFLHTEDKRGVQVSIKAADGGWGPGAGQLKSLLVRIMGASRVQTYRIRQTQLEVIFTQTAGHLLLMV